MSPATSPLAVPCDACGAVIEGAGIVEHMRAWHPWCWHARERAVEHPGLDAVARDLAQRELSGGAHA